MIKDHTEGYYWQDDYYPDINHVYKSTDYKYDIDVRLIDGCGDAVSKQRLEKSVEVLKEFEDKFEIAEKKQAEKLKQAQARIKDLAQRSELCEELEKINRPELKNLELCKYCKFAPICEK